MERVFSYGTLMLPNIQKDLFGKFIVGKSDILHGYVKRYIIIEGETYPCIMPEKGSQVEGFVIELSKDELLKIDKYEGEEYKRVKLSLGSGIETWVYVVNNESLTSI